MSDKLAAVPAEDATPCQVRWAGQDLRPAGRSRPVVACAGGAVHRRSPSRQGRDLPRAWTTGARRRHAVRPRASRPPDRNPSPAADRLSGRLPARGAGAHAAGSCRAASLARAPSAAGLDAGARQSRQSRRRSAAVAGHHGCRRAASDRPFRRLPPIRSRTRHTSSWPAICTRPARCTAVGGTVCACPASCVRVSRPSCRPSASSPVAGRSRPHRAAASTASAVTRSGAARRERSMYQTPESCCGSGDDAAIVEQLDCDAPGTRQSPDKPANGPGVMAMALRLVSAQASLTPISWGTRLSKTPCPGTSQTEARYRESHPRARGSRHGSARSVSTEGHCPGAPLG